jgi:hypothetical protein
MLGELASAKTLASATPHAQRAIWWREWLDAAPDAALDWFESRLCDAVDNGLPGPDDRGAQTLRRTDGAVRTRAVSLRSSEEQALLVAECWRILWATSSWERSSHGHRFRTKLSAVTRLLRLAPHVLDLPACGSPILDPAAGPTPELRLLGYLARIPGEETVRSLEVLAGEATESWRRDELRNQAAQRAAEDVASAPRDIKQVSRLWGDHKVDLLSEGDVFRAIGEELTLVQRALVSGRFSLAPLFDLRNRVAQERDVQTYVAHELELRARGRYTVDCEPEVQRRLRLDILVRSTAADASVLLEFKVAEQNRTLGSLESDLRHQLVRDYLKPSGRRVGIYVVASCGRPGKRWKTPSRGLIGFAELIEHLVATAAAICREDPEIDDLLVMPLDFHVPPPASR